MSDEIKIPPLSFGRDDYHCAETFVSLMCSESSCAGNDISCSECAFRNPENFIKYLKSGES